MELTYLDHAATTPMWPDAVAAMLPFYGDRFANPSGSHRMARDARRAIDEARDQVAELIGVAPGEVVFTSGGTESDNMVVSGTAGRAVCSAAEHHAVLDAVGRAGGIVVGVDAAGEVDRHQLAAALSPEVGLVSVMAVNNEVGTITDMAAVAATVRGRAPRAVLHTDAVQAAAWLDLRTIAPHVDAISLSAHKFGGPKGVGVLTMRRGVTVTPMLVGGGQERDLRSGTHAVGAIVAMATALAITDANRAAEVARLGRLRNRLVESLTTTIDGVTATVPLDRTAAGFAHVCCDGVDNEELLFLLDEAGVCVSAASACASGAMEPSHVLAAMGVDRGRARGALRFTLGHTTTEADIDRAVAALMGAVSRLRAVRVTAGAR